MQEDCPFLGAAARSSRDASKPPDDSRDSWSWHAHQLRGFLGFRGETPMDMCHDQNKTILLSPNEKAWSNYFHKDLSRKFWSQTSDDMDRWKAQVGRIREEKRREEERRSEKRKSQKKEDAGAWKGRKVANHCLFPMISALKRRVRSQLAKWEMNNCTPLWREAHFEVKMCKTPLPRNIFWRLRRRFAWQVQGIVHLVKVSKTLEFCSMSKNDGRCGTFEEDLQRCISRGRRSTRDMFIRDVWRSGHWFPDRRSILEHQIFRFAKMVCVTGAALETDGVEKSQNTLVRGRQLCTQLSIFEGSLAECFVFDVVNFELRKSRRIAALLMLSSSKAEEV